VAISFLGFFLALGFLTASFIVWQKGKEENYDAEPLMDAIILGSILGLAGARLFWVLEGGANSPSMAINFFKYPGFSYFGALFAGLAFLVFFCRRQKLDFWKLVDVLVFAIIPAQILVRIGNFLDGSYLGRPTGLPWGIKFPGLKLRVHPVSLYEIIFLIVILILVKKLDRSYRLFDWYRNKRGEAAPGFLLGVYLFAYGIFAFLLEFIKDSKLYWKGLSLEQWFSVGLVLTSLLVIYTRTGRNWQTIFSYARQKAKKIIKRQKKEKFEVIVPREVKSRLPIKRPIHLKVGMDAKET